MRRQNTAFWLALLLLLCAALPAIAQDAVPPAQAQALLEETGRSERALLIGIDSFVSKPSIYPGSTNNVYAMQTVFQAAKNPLAALIVPKQPVTSPKTLQTLIQKTFAPAKAGDVSYLYISTHGVYDPESGEEPALLLSDGVEEGRITPKQLQAAFDGIAGTKVIILDACNSGAFIGKGLRELPQDVCFVGDDFKVITSSGALEESWYWSTDQTEDGELQGRGSQGAFYFTQVLSQSLTPANGYPADQNHDGNVTLTELYEYLLLNHAASTPQVYPQVDDFVVFTYDIDEPLPTGLDRSPVMDVTFSGTMLSRTARDITIEFIATRPVRVAYQIVYQRDGKWEFDKAQLIYDEAERFTAFGDRAGAVSAGRKVRRLAIGEMSGESYGYVLVQLVSIDDGRLSVHGGRVICIPPDTQALALSVQASKTFTANDGRELSIFVGHDYPCALSVAIVDENEQVVRRLCHRRSTRPMQITPDGSVFYWDGTLKDGQLVQSGTYRVRAQATMNDETVTAFSEPFTIQ